MGWEASAARGSQASWSPTRCPDDDTLLPVSSASSIPLWIDHSLCTVNNGKAAPRAYRAKPLDAMALAPFSGPYTSTQYSAVEVYSESVGLSIKSTMTTPTYKDAEIPPSKWNDAKDRDDPVDALP
jgi:hypothetical protein